LFAAIRARFEMGIHRTPMQRHIGLDDMTAEALAAGKTLVATAVGGIPEIFGSQSPVLVPPDVEALARQMARALVEPQAFAALMPSIEALKARFGADVMAASIENAYCAALRR
jgi:glycosyltransferase involved in cell wall biosynthesis